MYWKVLKDDKIIDVLDNLVFLKYQEKHNRMIFCEENYAQAIFSSDEKEIWHVDGLYDIPIVGYDTVRIEEIDKYEYKRLKALNLGTMESIIDEFIKSLINGDTSLLIDSLCRLYSSQEIDKNMAINLCKKHNIAENEMLDILS